MNLLLSLAAVSGLAISAFWKLPLASKAFAASDLKTLYTSTWCFAHGQNAFSSSNLQAVFAANHVLPPPTWFGHAPVYPPATLMLLAPLAWMQMVPALYTALVAFVVLLALGLAGLLRYSAEEFGLGLPWRLVAVALFAAGPLLGFALTMGNVSVAASALAILAFVCRKRTVWLAAVALALSLLLKPHLALWIAVAMFLLPERRSRGVALRGFALAVSFAVITALWMSVTGTFALQMHGYAAILRAETGGGASMSVGSHELLPVISQITSLQSLLGFWTGGGSLNSLLAGAVLAAAGVFLLWQTRRQATEGGALLSAGAWCSFGMLATYHRGHDAIVLLLLLPWVLQHVRQRPRDWRAWIVVLLYGAMSIGPQVDTLARQTAHLPQHALPAFLLLRQAGLAGLCMLLVLLAALGKAASDGPEGTLVKQSN